MKILANAKIKAFFDWILCSILIFTAGMILFAALLGNRQRLMAFCLPLCPLGMGLMILAGFYRYFKEQNETMEQAVKQIRDRISGSDNTPIECNEEGELYRLFHEVNTLVSMLNAHAENQKREKLFLKNTISDISHQLKTPLAALNIYNGIIQEEAGEFGTIREFAGFSEQELDRMESLIQNLLKMAKFDSGTIVMEKTRVNVSEIMERVKQSFAFRARQEEKEICLSGEEEVCFLCDQSWMTEAVGNLVKNALDHTDKKGIIEISWRQAGSVLRITVRDNGRGICREDLYHIFKRFYRSRYSKDTKGIGLGLPLAKAIVEAHGGTIKVDSEPEMGTIFTLDFLQNCSPEVTGL